MGAYQLKNEELTLTVISAGAEMKSLKDNKTEQEYLWQADPKFWGRTSPVLFPIVGNYAQKQSVYEGKTYTLYVENPEGDVEKTLGVGFSYEPKTEKGTELLINGNNVDGTLIAKTVTNRFDMETFCVVLLFVLYIVFFVKFLYRLFK